jgi:hypothetical protein
MANRNFLGPVFSDLALNLTDHFTLLCPCYGEAGPCSNETPPIRSSKYPDRMADSEKHAISSLLLPLDKAEK